MKPPVNKIIGKIHHIINNTPPVRRGNGLEFIPISSKIEKLITFKNAWIHTIYKIKRWIWGWSIV